MKKVDPVQKHTGYRISHYLEFTGTRELKYSDQFIWEAGALAQRRPRALLQSKSETARQASSDSRSGAVLRCRPAWPRPAPTILLPPDLVHKKETAWK